jgi:hypothetical protein
MQKRTALKVMVACRSKISFWPVPEIMDVSDTVPLSDYKKKKMKFSLFLIN